TTPAIASYPKVRRASPVARYWRGLHRAEASLRFLHAAFGPRRTLSDTRSRQPYVTLAHHNHRGRNKYEDRMEIRPCIHRACVALGSMERLSAGWWYYSALGEPACVEDSESGERSGRSYSKPEWRCESDAGLLRGSVIHR